jgi:serine/threonine protein phosphatase PrpC
LLKLEPVALTHVGRKRSNNQDYLGDLIFKSGRKFGPEKLNERGHLFAVADGMGGYAGGEVASELAITTLFERYYNGPSSGDIASDLSEAIRSANLKVHTEASGSGRPQMGTTLTTVLVKGNKAIFGNVGDSRTYLIRQGLPERVTHDHSLVQDQIDAGVLTPEQAERSAIKNFITRAIGHRDEVESDLFEREIQPNDVLLLCSDGLHGLVKEIELGTVVATAPSMQEAAQTLVDMANDRGGHDNISVMLIRVEDVGEPLPPILKGREPVYNSNRAVFNQQTEPLGAVPQSSNSGTTVSQADRPTVPTPVPVMAPAVPAAFTQSTLPMTTLTETRPKKSKFGLIIGLLALLIVAGGVAAFVLLAGGSPNIAATPSPVPVVQPTVAPTPTITVTPAQTTPVAAPATVTPAPPTGTPVSTAGAVAAPSNNNASPTPSGPVANVAGETGRPTSQSGSLTGTNQTPGVATLINTGNCPGVKSDGDMFCWSVSSLATVREVEVELANFSGDYVVRLNTLDSSNTTLQSVSLNPVPGASGHYKANVTGLAVGSYRLELSRITNSTTPLESYNLKLGPRDAEAWAVSSIKITQKNTALLVEVTARR